MHGSGQGSNASVYLQVGEPETVRGCLLSCVRWLGHGGVHDDQPARGLNSKGQLPRHSTEEIRGQNVYSSIFIIIIISISSFFLFFPVPRWRRAVECCTLGVCVQCYSIYGNSSTKSITKRVMGGVQG